MSNIEDNFGLIWAIIYRFYRVRTNFEVTEIVSKYGMDYEDVFQISAIAYLRAEKNYKPDLGVKLSTFAGHCIKDELIKLRRDFNTNKRDTSKIKFLHLDYQDSVSDRFLSETVADQRDGFEKIDNKDLVDRLLVVLSEKERRCITDYYLNFKSQCQIAKELGNFQSNVGEIIRRSLVKMRKTAVS